MRRLWSALAILAILGLCGYGYTILVGKPTANYVETSISAADLMEGDLIFWKLMNDDQRADHVAAVLSTTYEQNRIRIIHATNNKQFYGFKDTFLPANKKMDAQSKYFYVVRIQDPEARKRFMSVLYKWLEYKMPFNAEHERIMKEWDSSMAIYPEYLKIKLQNLLFLEKNYINKINPNEGLICTEVIIVALQHAFFKNWDLHELPSSLKLDPSLCPPSTLMQALIRDQKNFNVLGRLTIS